MWGVTIRIGYQRGLHFGLMWIESPRVGLNLLLVSTILPLSYWETVEDYISKLCEKIKSVFVFVHNYL